MHPITENHNPDTVDIDLQNGYEIARMINAEDKKVATAVKKVLKDVGKAIDEIAKRVLQGGRVAYFGAGTSGRIGVLDASEMPPTYGVPSDLFCAYIAGGDKALRHAVENAEDSAELALADIKAFNVQKNDTLICISASGNPLYTYEILRMAQQKGALAIAISSNPMAKMQQFADIFINPIVGPEAVTGSSRMKSGTAQKMILNMISTGVMVKIGKTYKNYMIDLQINNQKLYERAVRFVREITGADENEAKKVLQKAKNVKTACVMLMKSCSKAEAEKKLRQVNGVLRRII